MNGRAIFRVINRFYRSQVWDRLQSGKEAAFMWSIWFKIWHLLKVVPLWTILIERNDKVFNHEQWHESKVKHRIWDELIIYAEAAWERVLKQIKINNLSLATMLQDFDETWGARNFLCRRNNLHIQWN
jgi:hypothetical protein